MKIFWFDTETTGIDPIINDIIQISGIVEVGGKEMERFNFKCQPVSFDNISVEALKVNHTTLEDIKSYESPANTYKKLTTLMSKYCNKYDKGDKFHMGGYNVKFDSDFLREFFKKNGDNYFGSWFNGKYIDPLPVLNFMEYCGYINFPNYKLSTVCSEFHIAIDAHDAMEDIEATVKVCNKLKEMLNVK